MLSGASAASHHGADLLAFEQIEAYVREKDLDALRREYGLRRPSDGQAANVVVRVPEPDWPFSPDLRVAPPLVVAADLLDAGDARSVRAARRLFREAR